ncbi:hypothetical protein CF392_02650 [Tamilnaduibacter salinus]|uniref:Ice-binding protein C-terminal domain-containing protein n=1 Tax=Tamilnaduibacter salinus TaxID=1484056 RepID=A0A2A2I7G7_9GAMM|nr:PEP-CTERM sorting domain-containing protein [Tamilnaduibacter salinus]PAV27055.1 hypothetical protein CF392_02650 [Tamilnaduibacter salinus]
MKVTHMLTGIALAIGSTAALGTPQYLGQTTASGTPTMDDPGYYIWNDESNPKDWSVRWTAPGADHDPVEWFGGVVFETQQLDTTSVDKFQFETGGLYGDDLTVVSGFAGDDIIDYTAATNDTGGVDGFDFTLEGNTELLGFDLGSSLFADLDQNLGDPGVASTGIFISEDLLSTNVLVEHSDDGVSQQFEIPVPEPGSLALLGLGLAGFGATRLRRRS